MISLQADFGDFGVESPTSARSIHPDKQYFRRRIGNTERANAGSE